ncbi:unnamed protein product [Ceutorhynchus assimilis]|uniref:Regulatory protein zeste n=1 Tax=Ceutorhynchus assimilis TaxID=467358 RepID=A0A9N9QS93_9CUCU|nr:unnamed protein product [Ceutorhynchus assimilis]
MEKKRTTKTQFKIYLSFLRENPVLLTGKLNPSTTNPEDIIKAWEKLTTTLNSCKDGPMRDTASWKKAFTEWNSNARKKARENKPLTDLENAIINITGAVAVKGITVPELGLQVQNEPKEDEEHQYQEENLSLGQKLVDEVQKMDFDLDEEVVVLEVVDDDDKPQEVTPNRAPNIPKKNQEEKSNRDQLEELLAAVEKLRIAVASMQKYINSIDSRLKAIHSEEGRLLADKVMENLNKNLPLTFTENIQEFDKLMDNEDFKNTHAFSQRTQEAIKKVRQQAAYRDAVQNYLKDIQTPKVKPTTNKGKPQKPSAPDDQVAGPSGVTITKNARWTPDQISRLVSEEARLVYEGETRFMNQALFAFYSARTLGSIKNMRTRPEYKRQVVERLQRRTENLGINNGTLIGERSQPPSNIEDRNNAVAIKKGLVN